VADVAGDNSVTAPECLASDEGIGQVERDALGFQSADDLTRQEGIPLHDVLDGDQIEEGIKEPIGACLSVRILYRVPAYALFGQGDGRHGHPEAIGFPSGQGFEQIGGKSLGIDEGLAVEG